MFLDECLSDEILIETKVVWARKGKNQVTKKYRCTYGQRKGRAVSSPSQCSAPIDLKKRMSLRKTKAKYGPRLIRKALKTKKYNAASRRIQ
jgi:hypothetical protein